MLNFNQHFKVKKNLFLHVTRSLFLEMSIFFWFKLTLTLINMDSDQKCPQLAFEIQIHLQ